MKNSILFITLIGLFFSCVAVEETQPELDLDIIGQWNLIKMQGSFNPDEMVEGEEMEWQETYYFYDDITFTKIRLTNGISMQRSGIYTQVKETVILTFDGDSEIIGNCGLKNSETLYFNADNTLKNSWEACDGPLLIYEKK